MFSHYLSLLKVAKAFWCLENKIVFLISSCASNVLIQCSDCSKEPYGEREERNEAHPRAAMCATLADARSAGKRGNTGETGLGNNRTECTYDAEFMRLAYGLIYGT